MDGRCRLGKLEAATRGREEAGPGGGEENPGAVSSRRKAKATAALERRKARPFGPGEEAARRAERRPASLDCAGGWTVGRGRTGRPLRFAEGNGRARGRHEKLAAAPRARLRLTVERDRDDGWRELRPSEKSHRGQPPPTTGGVCPRPAPLPASARNAAAGRPAQVKDKTGPGPA